jgi:hypothetical protein
MLRSRRAIRQEGRSIERPYRYSCVTSIANYTCPIILKSIHNLQCMKIPMVAIDATVYMKYTYSRI